MIRKTISKISKYLQRKRGKNGNNQPTTLTDFGGKENEEPSVKESPPEIDVKISNCQNQDNSGKLIVKKDERKADELPYDIQYSDIMGRYLVASRDLKPGDIIIRADPLVVGPCAGCGIICLGCYIPLVKDIVKCPGCMWPICSKTCSGLHQTIGHTDDECNALKKYTKLDYSNLKNIQEVYQAVVPLRCLLYKSSDPERWNEINKMVAHNEIRMKVKDLWKNNQDNVVDKIIKTWGMTQYTEEEIHTICGILEVNAFEVGQIGLSIRGLYPRAYLLAHDCTPNTTHTDDERRRLTVRASMPIERGQAITLSYAYTLQSTHKRREHLTESKFFECCCERCADPKEFGTFTSALLCPKCTGTKGVVLPINSLDADASWQCNTCTEYTLKANAVKGLVQKMNDEYDLIDVNDVEGYECFLSRYRNVLHPTHYLCLSSKHALSQLYGKVDSHMIHQMTHTQLLRKIDICREILRVFDVLEPGYSRLRGITLYELHAPLMILTTRDYEKKTIKKDELRVRLKEVVDCLREAAKILSIEPRESSEGIMATAAIDALRRIKDWEKIIGKI